MSNMTLQKCPDVWGGLEGVTEEEQSGSIPQLETHVEGK